MARKLPILDGQNRTVAPFTNVQVFDRSNTTAVRTVTMNPLSQVQTLSTGFQPAITVYTLAEANPYKLGISLGQIFVEGTSVHFIGDIGQNTVKVFTLQLSNNPVVGAKTLQRWGTSSSNPPTDASMVTVFSGSWTVPLGITRAKVTAIGGGGGGGGGRYVGAAGAGGAGGGTVIKIFNNLVPGATYNFYIGNGGWGSPGGTPNGHSWPWPADTGTSFSLPTTLAATLDGRGLAWGTLEIGHGGHGYCTFFDGPTPLYAFGGMGGTSVIANNVNNSSYASHSNLGVTAGSTTFTQTGTVYTGGGAYGGDINIPGEPNGHGGGGFHGGNAGSTSIGGKGGNSVYGVGASANPTATGAQNFQGDTRSIIGQPGRGYGAGGSGGAYASWTSNSTSYGGLGTAGAVIIEW
jgi:hypothetical protein